LVHKLKHVAPLGL